LFEGEAWREEACGFVEEELFPDEVLEEFCRDEEGEASELF
jgi:hypothetical protein